MKKHQKIKKAISLLMVLILSLFSVNPVNAQFNISWESPINQGPSIGGDEYKVVSNLSLASGPDGYYWEDNSNLVLEEGGRIRLFNYWDQDKSISKWTFWKIFFWTVVQGSYTQTGGLLTMDEFTRIRLFNAKITGGTIELASNNPNARIYFDGCWDASVKLIMKPSNSMAMYIGKTVANTINLLSGSFLRNPYIYVGSVVNAGNDTEITFDGTVNKPKVYFWGKLNSKLNSKVNFNSVKHTTAKKSILTMDGGELKLSNSTLTLKPESFLNDARVILDTSSFIFENNSLNTIYTPATTGSIQVVSGTLRIVPKPIESILEYSVPTTVKGGILEIKDRNVASTFITVKAPIINEAQTCVSDATIANNITGTGGGGYRMLDLFRTVTFADNIYIKQKYMRVMSGITTLGKNINLSIDEYLMVKKGAKLLNPYSIISIRELSNYGTIDGKDGKYGNLNVRVANTGSIIQNDITLNGWDSYNSGFIESKGKFINNREVWTNINNTGSLTVNNAEFNGNIKQANLTVNGNAIQKADINLTKQLAVSNSGAITNNSNKIIADSLYNRGSISGDKSRANSIEVNTDSNLGGITQQNITIKGNFTNNGAIEAFSGYLQAMMRNGGRTGVALNAGIRWAFGND